MTRHEQIMEIMANDPDVVADMLVKWETEVGKTMPFDFKDWWENSPSEWPLVVRLVIESLRERERSAWDMLANAERIHGGAGAGKPRDASTPLDGASC